MQIFLWTATLSATPPSTVNLTEGDHTITVTRNGFKTWERKIKAMGGMVRLNAELEPQQDAQK